MGRADADLLRGHGWNDAAIHDAIQVISYFNYVNRSPKGSGSRTSPSGTPVTDCHLDLAADLDRS